MAELGAVFVLDDVDRELIDKRRGDHNRLGFGAGGRSPMRAATSVAGIPPAPGAPKVISAPLAWLLDPRAPAIPDLAEPVDVRLAFAWRTFSFRCSSHPGPTLLVDVFCPDCGGCGNGDPNHLSCDPALHAWADAEELLQDDESSGENCRSCDGRGWNAVEGFNEQETVTVRVPCGCMTDQVRLL